MGLLNMFRFVSPRLVALLLTATPLSGLAESLHFHVSPAGSDENPGTLEAPFLTLTKARDAIRVATGRTQNGGALPGSFSEATVSMSAGTYYLREPLALDGRDQGVAFRAPEGQTAAISGGLRLERDWWKALADPSYEARVKPSVRSSVYRLNLRNPSEKSLGQMGVAGSRMDLILSGSMMIPAQWPNASWQVVTATQGANGVKVDSNRIKAWNRSEQMWLHGYWSEANTDGWNLVESIDANEKIFYLASSPGATAGQWFQAVNVLEEMDEAGEWWYDAERAQILCFPDDVDDLDAAILAFAPSLVQLTGAHSVSFRNLTLEAARSDLLTASNSNNIRLESLVLRNAGGWAVSIDGGENALISESAVTGMGEGGIALSGGDRAALVEAGHVADTVLIDHCGRINRAEGPAFKFSGVGMTVRNCVVEDMPGPGLVFSGNEHLIENCEFRRVSLETAGLGAIVGRSGWTGRGNTIRNNIFQEVRASSLTPGLAGASKPAGVLLAGATSETTVIGNTFSDCGYGIRLEGGRDNITVGNAFTEADTPFFLSAVSNHPGLLGDLETGLGAVPRTGAVWSGKYPKLGGLSANELEAPENNLIEGNHVSDMTWLVDATTSAQPHVDTASINSASEGEDQALGQLVAFTLPGASDQPVPSIVYYIAPDGNDANPGSAAAPFRTLIRARDAIRVATGRTTSGAALNSDWDGARVILSAGNHYVGSTVFFDDRDSGTEQHPIEYIAAPGVDVVVSAAQPVPDDSWVLVTAANDFVAHGRLPGDASGHVYRLDVNALGIDKGILTAWMFDLWHPNEWNKLRLIVGNEAKYMSRYPNWPDDNPGNWLTLSNFSEGNRYGSSGSMSYQTGNGTPAGWSISGETVFAQGSLDVPYHIMWQPISSLQSNGNGGTKINVAEKTVWRPVPFDAAYEANTQQFVCIRNSISGMSPDSYAWAHGWGYLYYWSPSGAPHGASLMEAPAAVQFGKEGDPSKACSYVTFRDLAIEGGRFANLKAFGSTAVRFEQCEVRNGGYMGFQFTDCWKSGMWGGSLHHMAQDACVLGGGNEVTLTPSENELNGVAVYEIGYDLNADISMAVQSRLKRYQTNVNGEGYGLWIRNCTFENLRDGIVNVAVGNVLIEDCSFSNFNMLVGDTGGLSGGFKFSLRNNAIRRCTFKNSERLALHKPAYGGKPAVYLDLMSDFTIEDCTFENLDHAIWFAGKDMVIRRNKFTNANNGHFGAPIIAMSRQSHVLPGKVAGDVIEADLLALPLSQVPWTAAYPNLIQYRRGGSRSAIIGHHEGPVIVDNLNTTAGQFLIRVYAADLADTNGGFPTGIDMNQLNYPVGVNLMPVENGGSVMLSSVARN